MPIGARRRALCMGHGYASASALGRAGASRAAAMRTVPLPPAVGCLHTMMIQCHTWLAAAAAAANEMRAHTRRPMAAMLARPINTDTLARRLIDSWLVQF
eukprot:SAG31_NODE_1220_length_9296_cov_3.409046_2_plen_100_part_00